MKVYTGSRVTVTSEMDEGECSASGTSRFNPGNNPDINGIRGMLSPKAGLEVSQRNLLLCQDLIPKLQH